MDFFPGSSSTRRVNLSGRSGSGTSAAASASRAATLDHARKEREERLKEKKKEQATKKIQVRERDTHRLFHPVWVPIRSRRRSSERLEYHAHACMHAHTLDKIKFDLTIACARARLSHLFCQSFWRSRHRHSLVVASHRAAFDEEFLRLTSAGTGMSATTLPIPAATLERFVTLYLSFTRIGRTRPKLPPRDTPRTIQTMTEDERRWRQLVKILLISYRGNKDGHLGARMILPTAQSDWHPSASGSSSSSSSSSLPPLARQWVHQSSRLIRILLEQIGRVDTYGMDQVTTQIALLWMMIDSNQWAFVKDAAGCTNADRAIIQRTQQSLIRQIVQPIGEARLPTRETATVVPASSSSSSRVASSPRPLRPCIDLFHCLRTRILDLTFLPQDGQPTPTQIQQKTSVALMVATIIRAMTITATTTASDIATAHTGEQAVTLSYIYHILSIPALPQRLRLLQLQALLPSFLLPALWDRSLSLLTSQLAQKPTPNGVVSQFTIIDAATPPTLQALTHTSFAAISHTWFDTLPAARRHTQDDHAMEVDLPTASASSSSSSPPPNYTYFTSSKEVPIRSFSGLVWIFGNLLDLVGSCDETKNESTSRSFSFFLAAIQQLIRLISPRDLPTISTDGVDLSSTQANGWFPRVLVQQFGIFGERAFLDRLCKRLLSGDNNNHNNNTIEGEKKSGNAQQQDVDMKTSDTSMVSSSSAPSTPSPPTAALSDIPVICVLIDSILYRWSASSNSILNTLVFSSNIVERLWGSIRRSGLLERIELAGRDAASTSTATASSSSAPPTSSYPSSASLTSLFSDRFFDLLPLFCTMFGHLLLILDDEEFFIRQKPFSLEEDIIPMVGMLKTLLYHLYWSGFSSNDTSIRLRERFSRLFIQLRDRQTRKQFMSPDSWLYNTPAMMIPLETLQLELSQEDEMKSEMPDAIGLLPPSRASCLVNTIPFVLPFNDRVKLLYTFIDADKRRQRSNGIFFDHGMGRRIKIRRQFVLEDAFQYLGGLSGPDAKGRIQVEFTDEHGIPEPGLDGGGLWKELLTTLLKTVFDPSYALFAHTEQHFLYPNPQALDVPILTPEQDAMADPDTPDHAHQALAHFSFIGQMIGKALYDGIQIETQFALFFLRFLVGHQNYLDDLQGLDPVIYSSLMKLKSIPPTEDVSQLGITFSVDRQVFGVNKTYELIPNGANVPVTNENKMRFIYLMSDYYLHKCMSRQMSAFQSGLLSILDPHWLRMFAAEELRLLISGSQRIDRHDLRMFTQYSSGYTKDHELIRMFWEVVEELSEEEMSLLLKFATSCSRAPLLGFKYLYPQFCIQRVEPGPNEGNLPTAATCMNLLRLPRFTTKQRLKEKLLYAITAASTGFGLT